MAVAETWCQGMDGIGTCVKKQVKKTRGAENLVDNSGATSIWTRTDHADFYKHNLYGAVNKLP